MKPFAPQPLYSHHAYTRHGHRLIVILGGWKTKQWHYRLTARALLHRGYDCVIYTYCSDVFSPDAPGSAANLNAITDAVLTGITQLNARGYRNISLLGFSLGTMIACMVADRSPEITKIILNLTSTDPAEAVWGWDTANPKFKQNLVRQGVTLDQLRKLWASIAPINNLKHAQGKQFLVYLAKHDNLMPYQAAKEIITQIERAGGRAQLITNMRSGHTVAGFHNLLNVKQWVHFLET